MFYRDAAALGRQEGGSLTDAAASSSPLHVRLAATGDLLLASDPTGALTPRDPACIFRNVQRMFAGSDVVLGNLECTLPGDGSTVPTEPRVVSTPEMIRTIGAAGFNVVTLANNHTFDCLQAGFHNVRDLLGQMGVAFFGAGDDLAQATGPAIIEVRGIRIAFLGAVDRRAGASHFAGAGQYGVAPLDADRLAEEIRRLKEGVHHVILSLHWGEERFRFPAPGQIEQARRLAEAGASLILCHHPHVIQGMETWNGVPIVYSLGNFVASDIGYAGGDRLTWNRRERTGCLFTAELTASDVRDPKQVATYDAGRSVNIDHSPYGHKIIAKANSALARGVTRRRYRREYLWVKTLKPALQHLRWSQLRRLRFAQVRKALSGLLCARKAE